MIRFSKMHGAGNDFVVIDACRQSIPVEQVDWRQLADRHFGIGADQILIVQPPQDSRNDFRYRIFNADGAEVEQCGNGARCFVRFVHEQGLSEKKKLAVETLTGLIAPELIDEASVKVDMGFPRFDMRSLGFVDGSVSVDKSVSVDESVSVIDQSMGIVDKGRAGAAIQFMTRGRVEMLRMESPATHLLPQLDIELVSMGNPHAVVFLNRPADDALLQIIGPFVCNHPVFPKQINVGFAFLQAPDQLVLRVYERGAGETLSCGTGACAAAVLAMEQKSPLSSLQVRTRGGNLWVEWAGGQSTVAMLGPASTVYEGRVVLPLR